jgi:hypothetical protein
MAAADGVLDVRLGYLRICCPRRPCGVRINIWRPDAVELSQGYTRREYSNSNDSDNEKDLFDQLTASLEGASSLETHPESPPLQLYSPVSGGERTLGVEK